MVVQVPRTFLLAPPLIAVLLLQLQRLHLCGKFLHLLAEPADLRLKLALHVLLDRLRRPLSLVRILRLILHSVDLLAVLAIAFFEVRGPNAAILERKLQVPDLLSQVFDLACLLAIRSVGAYPLSLDLILHFNSNHGLLLVKQHHLL